MDFERSMHEYRVNNKVEKAVINENCLKFKNYTLIFEAVFYRYDEVDIEFNKFTDFSAWDENDNEVDLSDSEVSELIEKLKNYDVSWEVVE